MISVCMTTYNGQEFIMKQLTSILSQLSENDEVIISDDGSVDNTLQIIQNINDSRIILLRHKSALKGKKNDINFKRRKCILNFENALSKAKGDIIILSDQDDIWYNNRVLRAKESLRENYLMICDCSIIDENDVVLTESRFKERNPRLGLFNILYKNPFLGCCMAFRREVLEKALPFPQNIPMHDIWLGAVAQMYFKPILVHEILVGYRRHTNNINNQKTNYSEVQKQKHALYPIHQKIAFRFNTLSSLIKIALR